MKFDVFETKKIEHVTKELFFEISKCQSMKKLLLDKDVIIC